MSLPQAASSFAASSLRLASQLTQSTTGRRCPQCLRSFASYKSFHTSTKRRLQTASAVRPLTFDSPPPPPRGSFNPSAPIAKDTSSKVDEASIAGNKAAATPLPVQKPQPPVPAVQPSQLLAKTFKPAPPEQKKAPRQFKFAPRKATIKLTPTAVHHVRQLLDQPEPKLLRIGTKNKGCSGLAYNLEYVDKPGKFDETVEQDGVKVLIESRTLLHIIGSEMDWVEDKLSARFVFKNPNITEQCGCGESFSII